MRSMRAVQTGCLLLLVLAPGFLYAENSLQVSEAGKTPDKKITVTMPGLYKAVVWQASGGGISEFYDLVADPEAKLNFTKDPNNLHSLFEIGWHGVREYRDSEGKVRPGSGSRFWPYMRDRRQEDELEVIEKSPARVRVRAKAFCTTWEKERVGVKDVLVTCIYTFSPTAQIVIAMKIQGTDSGPYHWSWEHGPHLFVRSGRDPEAWPGLVFASPKGPIAGGFREGAEELVMACNPTRKVKTSFIITIPPQAQDLFNGLARHDGRTVGWDRCGYGRKGGTLIEKGKDQIWACMIQMGTEGSPLAPELKTPREALPYALQYRLPPKVTGAEFATDDPGDFNKDGFNESEGCLVLKGPGPLAFTYERSSGAGFAPVFKVRGWKGEVPRQVHVDCKAIPAAAAVVADNLLLQVLGTLQAGKARVEIGGSSTAQDKDAALPGGAAGLAARYPGDQGLDKDPDVVFAENFEEGNIQAVKKRWDNSNGDLSLAADVPPGSSGKSSLLITHVGGKGTGGQLYRRLLPGHERLFCRMYVKIDPDCHPIHHFGTNLGGNHPATPWPMVSAGKPPAGDKQFWTGVEPFGKRWVWDYYTYWCEMRGSPPRGQTWGNSFIWNDNLKVTRGQWQCLEFLVKLNDLGDSNGEMAFWLDGKLVSHLGKGFPVGTWTYDRFQPGRKGPGIRWDVEAGKGVRIDGEQPFEGFRWRTVKELTINYAWIYLYLTTTPPGHVSRVWFDDVVIARKYIGPLAMRK